MVSNPLDAMVYVAMKKIPASRRSVIGMAGVLDSARFRRFVAMELGVSVEDVTAFVMGGHGDDMVPLPRYCTVSGIPLPDLLSRKDRRDRRRAPQTAGGEIVELSEDGYRLFSPAGLRDRHGGSVLKDKNAFWRAPPT